MGKRLTQEEFIAKSNIAHNFKYDYSKTVYTGCSNSIIIICPDHDEFVQNAQVHMMGHGCTKCQYEGFLKQTGIPEKEFIDKYICGKYELLTPYKGMSNPITIKCIFCQKITQLKSAQLLFCRTKRGNFSCECRRLDHFFNLFLEESKTNHGDIYDYSKSVYISATDPITVYCKKHGDFTTTPLEHKKGNGHCPKCSEGIGERKIRIWLEQNNISFVRQFSFEDLRSNFGKPLPFDFFLSDKNTIIEYDGPQHYNKELRTKNSSGGVIKYDFNAIKERDEIKNKYCSLKNIVLIRIPYFKFNDIHGILTKELLGGNDVGTCKIKDNHEK